MKKSVICIVLCVLLCLTAGCQKEVPSAQVVATTLPVYEFTSALCEGTDITVTQLVTEQVSCLHDYTLQVSQMRMVEGAQVLVMSGGGLEDFLGDLIATKSNVIDASSGVALYAPEHEEEHHEEHEDEHHHHHDHDPHIWLSPENAKIMVQNICDGLSQQYPQNAEVFETNRDGLLSKLDDLQNYGTETLKELQTRNLITFHDGFHYFADSFDLHIVKAIEEEAGSETSAHDLIDLINIVETNHLPAVFTERNGSSASANVISAETGCAVYSLNMAMSGNSYFDAMYHNINTIKEALG